jgi:flavin reductase (DIM6/NTAB) family NADH-FMN oxidoreductase RutF
LPEQSRRAAASRLIDPGDLSARDRYQLVTSLVVPRPIGWISTWDASGAANLAPYSFFNAISGSPMLVAVSVGQRRGEPKDTLVNLRSQRAFCVNVVTEALLEAMNATSAEVGPAVDEFALAGLDLAVSERVHAPFVAECPAVFECEVLKEVDLGESTNVLVVGRVLGVRLSEALPMAEGSYLVDSGALRAVGRMRGPEYMLPRETRILPRP